MLARARRRERTFPALTVLAVLCAAAACTSIATMAAYGFVYSARIYDAIEFPMEVYVDDVVGISIDTDKLYFGIVRPGGSSGREMTVTAGGFRTIVTFESSGDIAPWVTVSENNFALEPWESRAVMVKVSIPRDVVPLAYRNGTLRMVFRKA